MSFKPTSDFVFNLLNEAAAGNPVPLTEALEPDIKWRIGSETKDEVARTGVYVCLFYLPLRSAPLGEKNPRELIAARHVESRRLGRAGLRTAAI